MSAQPEEPAGDAPAFERAVHGTTRWMGSTPAILLVLSAVMAWLLCRPLFETRQDWQDAMTTPLCVLTFVLLFLLQRSQNKAMLAVQLKLNEIIASRRGASNRLIDLENLSEEDVARLHRHYQALAAGTSAEEDPGAPHSVEEAARWAEGKGGPPTAHQVNGKAGPPGAPGRITV